MRPRNTLSTLVAGTLLAACTVHVPSPELGEEVTRMSPQEADAHWARVLRESVDDEGRIDFDGRAADPRPLETYVAWLARVGPRTTPDAFPTRESRIAYYVNAYNALAMYNVLRSGVLPKSKVRFFYVRELELEGDTISLYTLENEIIRPLGEERIHFALNCMVKSCPRLPRAPFDAERLEEQLAAAAREFLASPRNVVVDHAEREVRFNAILDFYTEDFLAVAPSLADYANRHRDEPIPVGYAVEFLEYDWTLNAP